MCLAGSPKDGGLEVVRTVGWVVHLFVEEGQGTLTCFVEIAENVDALTVHKHHLLAQEMASAMRRQDLPLCYVRQLPGKEVGVLALLQMYFMGSLRVVSGCFLTF